MNDQIPDARPLNMAHVHGRRAPSQEPAQFLRPGPLALSYHLPRTGATRLLGALLSMLIFILAATVAYAHGGGAPQLTDAEAGPYRVYAWTQPEPWRVGEAHISIAVTLPRAADATVDEGVTNNALDTPVTDARVQVMLTPVDAPDANVTVQAAPQELLGNLYYEADATLTMPGVWRVTVDVSGPRGRGEASFTIDVLPARSKNTLLIAGGAGLAALALAALAGILRGRRTTEGVKEK